MTRMVVTVMGVTIVSAIVAILAAFAFLLVAGGLFLLLAMIRTMAAFMGGGYGRQTYCPGDEQGCGKGDEQAFCVHGRCSLLEGRGPDAPVMVPCYGGSTERLLNGTESNR